MSDTSRLQRPLQEMPADVRCALAERGLLSAYNQRPAYQRNDDLTWISWAKRPNQMLDELAQGGVYINMTHGPSA